MAGQNMKRVRIRGNVCLLINQRVDKHTGGAWSPFETCFCFTCFCPLSLRVLIFSALGQNRPLLLWLSAYCGLLPCLKHLQMKSLVKNLPTAGFALESWSFTKQQIPHRANDWGEETQNKNLVISPLAFSLSLSCVSTPLRLASTVEGHSEESIRSGRKSLWMEESDE